MIATITGILSAASRPSSYMKLYTPQNLHSSKEMGSIAFDKKLWLLFEKGILEGSLET